MSGAANGGEALRQWHKRMREENPELYSKIQRKRWKSLFQKYGKQICESRKKVETLYRRYGKDHFKRLALTTLEKTPLNNREKEVLELTDSYGLDLFIESHKTFEDFNVDFVYDNGRLVVEEVLGFKKKKSLLFYEILVIENKFQKLRAKGLDCFLITTWREQQLGYKVERFPIELMLWVLEKGITPIFLDIELFQEARRNILSGKQKNDGLIRCNLIKMINERNHYLEKGANVQYKQKFDKFEKEIEQLLIRKEFSPAGKKILTTKFNTFIVTDNYFTFEGVDYAVFVSKGDLEGLVGSAALVKELVNPEIKVICVLEKVKPIKRHLLKGSRGKLLKRYVDYFFSSLREFEGWALSSAW